MKMDLQNTIREMRTTADADPWDYGSDPTCPDGRTRRLVVAGRAFDVLFMLVLSPWLANPEHMLVVREVGKQRPNRDAVGRLVHMFFVPGRGRPPVVRADRHSVPLHNVCVFTQAVITPGRRRVPRGGQERRRTCSSKRN